MRQDVVKKSVNAVKTLNHGRGVIVCGEECKELVPLSNLGNGVGVDEANSAKAVNNHRGRIGVSAKF